MGQVRKCLAGLASMKQSVACAAEGQASVENRFLSRICSADLAVSLVVAEFVKLLQHPALIVGVE